MPALIARLLDTGWFAVLARVLLTFVFWSSGLRQLIDFQGTLGEMAFFGLQPAAAFAVACIAVDLIGSVLIILNRWTWLGAGALGVYTALTIPVAHDFWNKTGDAAFHDMLTAIEHVSVIGGLMVVAVLSRWTGGAGNGAPRNRLY